MKNTLLVIALFFSAFSVIGQTVVNLNASTHNTTENGCAYWFYDDGGVGAVYTASQDRWITFASSSGTNTHIRLSFASFNIEPGDTMFIYDGPSTAAPLIGWYNNSNPLSGSSTIVQATVSNVSGDITIRFKSNASNQTDGWNCSVSCIPQCQSIISSVDTLEMFPLPNDSNYIDICLGDVITFAATGAGPGVFPENDLLYHQDSSTTLFIWDFGDGIIDTGRVIDHLYPNAMGYDVFLTVIDTRGCTNTMLLNLRVRISANPIVDIKPLPDICAGDTIDLVVGENATSTIVVAPTGSFQVATELYDSTTFIPDGPSCLPNCYGTPVTFSTFPPGSTIQSAADIASICMSMEHTFVGDLSFSILCPNGTSVMLDSYDNSGGSDFGLSNSSDGSPTCSAAANPPGTGWTYCWSEVYPQQGLLNTLDAGTSPIPATDTINNTGYITPQNPLSGLVGCPLNGTWSIQICDEWGADNGYVFWWSLTLLNQTQSGAWSYTVPIDSVTWAGPFIQSTSDSTAYIAPDTAGIYTYVATVWDEYGCSYDTTLTIEVLPNPEPDLGTDTVSCGTSLFTLDAGPATNYFWSTGAMTQTIDVTSTGQYSVTVANTNGAATCYGADTISITVIPDATVDLGSDTCSHTPVALDAQNPGFTYDWSTGASTQTITANISGTYSVSVSFGTSGLCGDSDTIQIRVVPNPVLDLGADQEICPHEFAILDANQNSSEYDYLWSTGSSLPYVTVEDLSPGIYPYTVTITGCEETSDTVIVIVLACDLTIPNVITPGNGDGYNDLFKVTNLEYYPNSVLMVFNRWGKKIYESTNYQNNWDGEDFASGTYYYVLKVNFGDETYDEYNGTITILRD